MGSSRQMVVVASSLFMRSLVRYMKRLSLIWANVLAEGKHFTIEAHNASRVNKYVQSAVLNGNQLQSFRFPVSELLKGGTLTLEMDRHRLSWGIER